MIPDKFKYHLIISILLVSCGFVTDSNDYTVNPLVGTWNLTTVDFFNNPNCSGIPYDSLEVNSLDELAGLGLDEYQLELTVTIDSYIIVLLATSSTVSPEREEEAMTGYIVDHGDNYYVIYDTEDDRDDCDERKDYTINGNEVEIYLYNCLPSMPSPTGEIVPCQIFNMVKQQ